MEVATKRLKTAAAAPRLASYNHGLRLDNTMRHGLHRDGLTAWVPTDPERPATDDLAEGEAEPGLLTTICDEEGKQWSFWRFLSGAKKALWHQFFGQIHRRHNDWHRGLSMAGVLDVWVTMLFELNIGRGPFQSRQWHLELESHAFDCTVNMSPDHELLLFCWPGICEDHGWTVEADTNRDARALWLKMLVADRSVRLVGGSAAYNKWWSIYNGARINNDKVWTKLFVLMGLCMMKGWVADIDSMFRSNTRDPLPPAARGAVLPPGLGPEESAGAASSSSAGPVAKASAAKPVPVAKSVVAEKAKGKQVVSSLLQKSHNSLHALCRLMADPNRRQLVRTIIGLGKAMAVEHNMNCKVKTPDETVKYYVDMARSHWFEACKETMAMMADASFLKQAGLLVDVASTHFLCLKEDSPEVQAEDVTAERVWKIARCLCQERVSSMCRHKTYPEALAPVGIPGQYAEDALATFKETWDSYVWAMRHKASPEMDDLVNKHSLNLRHMQDTARIIRADEYKATSRVAHRINRYFTGFPHEHIFENANRELRHTSVKATANQVLKSVKTYMIPKKAGLLKDFERPEIQINSVVPISADIVKNESMYKSPDKTPTRANFQDIMGPQTWTTFDAQSAKVQSVLEALVRDMHKRGLPRLAQDVWRSAVCPVGQFVLHRADASEGAWMHLVLYKCKYGFIGWPVRRIHSCLWVDLEATDVVFKHLYTFKNIQILETTTLSPLHCQLLKDKTNLQNRGILRAIGDFVPLVDWQAKHGFLGCGEAVLKQLCQDQKLEMPTSTLHGLDYESSLCLSLIRHVLPDADHEDTASALCERAVEATRAADGDNIIDIPDDIMDDVINYSDRKEFTQFKKDVKASLATRDRTLLHIQKAVTESYGKVKAKPKDMTKKAAAAKLHTKAGLDRWWSSIKGDESWLRTWMPPGGGLFVDDSNGRFRVWYKGEGPRSVSWYKRGMEAASTESLRLLWGWHYKCTGEACPIPL